MAFWGGLKRRNVYQAGIVSILVFPALADAQIAGGSGDVIAVSDFRFRQPGFGTASDYDFYASGQTVETTGGELFLCIRNLTGNPLPNVEYRITSPTTAFDSGVRPAPNVAAASNYCAALPLTVSGGAHAFALVLDPNGKLRELARARLNNEANLSLTFLLIDRKPANLLTIAPPVPDSALFTVGAGGMTHCTAGPVQRFNTSLRIALYRSPDASPGDPDCHMNADLFQNVVVGNGWSLAYFQSTGPGEMHWYVRPEGTALHSHFGRYYRSAGPVNVVVWLKGPKGTEPTLRYTGLRLR